MLQLGWFGVVGSPKVIGSIIILYGAYDFLFDCNKNYVSMLYRFRVIVSYLLRVADFNLTHLHWHPCWG